MSMKCVVFAAALSCAAGGVARADVINKWNNIMLDAIRAGSTPPPRASRAMAMVQAAVFDAVNSVERRYDPYHAQFDVVGPTSKKAAAAAAAHRVLSELFPSQAVTFDAALAQQLSGLNNAVAKANGIALGQLCADDMTALRTGDNSDLVVPYVPGAAPGEWRPTAPANAPGLLPNWPLVAPFAMTSGDQFRQGGPPDLTSAEYAADYNEVKELGRIDSATRTAEQTEIARLWAAGGGTMTPPGQWNQIAQQIARDSGNSLAKNARMFAALGVAVADAGIVAWDMKYEYEFWRPITAIHDADLDGNAMTISDPTWAPLLGTPPFPEYTSGHSTFSRSAAAILQHLTGTDAHVFSVEADDVPGLVRSFTSLDVAADEAGLSRIYGGIHFEFSNADGQHSGQLLADYIFANFFAQVPAPGGAVLAALAGMIGLRRRR